MCTSHSGQHLRLYDCVLELLTGLASRPGRCHEIKSENLMSTQWVAEVPDMTAGSGLNVRIAVDSAGKIHLCVRGEQSTEL